MFRSYKSAKENLDSAGEAAASKESDKVTMHNYGCPSGEARLFMRVCVYVAVLARYKKY